MLLKIITGPGEDDSSQTEHKIISGVATVDFTRSIPNREGAPVAIVYYEDKSLGCEFFDLNYNAYLMNDNAKTITAFAHTPHQDLFQYADFPIVKGKVFLNNDAVGTEMGPRSADSVYAEFLSGEEDKLLWQQEDDGLLRFIKRDGKLLLADGDRFYTSYPT